jgi:hypothetical protein
MPQFASYITPDRYRSIAKILPVIRAGFPELRNDDSLAATQDSTLHDADWPHIIEFCMRNRVLPILYHNLKKTGLAASLPPDVKTFLQPRYTQICGNNMRLTRRLADLCGLFAENRIPVVPFKGPLLAHALYGDSAPRYCQDLDLLVPRQCLPEAWRLLHETGYRPREMSFTKKHFLMFARYGNEFDFTDARGATAIDLHWKIAKHTRHPFDMEFCAPRLKPVCFHDRVIHRLSDEDTILALCLNGGADLWPRLESILTLSDTIAAVPALNWDLLQNLARRLRCNRMLLLGLLLASDIFDITLPADIRRQMIMDKTLPGLAHRVYRNMLQNNRANGSRAAKFRFLVRQMHLREHPADKISYALSRFFIPTRKDWKRWPTDDRNVYVYLLPRPLELVRNVGNSMIKLFKIY